MDESYGILDPPLTSYFYTAVDNIRYTLNPIFNPFGRTKLPMFLLEKNHPWVNENRQWLEVRKDPTRDLCHVDSALNNGGIDGRVVPEDLFHFLFVDNNAFDRRGPTWRFTRHRLREMHGCPLALKSVKHLVIDPYRSDGRWHSRYDRIDPGVEVPELMVDVLSLMSNLELLEWHVNSESAPFFAKAFEEKGVPLPSVTHLIPYPSSEFLVPLCPNLSKLSIGSWGVNHGWSARWWSPRGDPDPVQVLLDQAAKLPSIQELEIEEHSIGWTCDKIKGTLQRHTGFKVLIY